MSVDFTSGDLFAAPDLRGLAHGCNCVGSMSGGIAVEFRRRWPAMYEAYREECRQGRFRLGDVFVWHDEEITIFNLATQQLPGADARLPAVETALRRMVALAGEGNISPIGLPRIGAGIGGLAWEDVRAVIERIAAQSPVHLVVFEEYRRGPRS